MKKVSAVEWLREQWHKVPQSQFGNLFKQAKAMEKQQIEKAFYDGDCNGTFETINASKYYNETYGKEGGEG